MSELTLIDGERTAGVPWRREEDRVRVPADALEHALGWRLRPEGLCRGDTCVPVREPDALLGPAGIDLERFAEALDRPLALDLDEAIAVLGASARERAAALSSLEAPDFELPDLAGRRQRLADQRGRKVLLVTWASW